MELETEARKTIKDIIDRIKRTSESEAYKEAVQTNIAAQNDSDRVSRDSWDDQYEPVSYVSWTIECIEVFVLADQLGYKVFKNDWSLIPDPLTQSDRSKLNLSIMAERVIWLFCKYKAEGYADPMQAIIDNNDNEFQEKGKYFMYLYLKILNRYLLAKTGKTLS